MKIADFARQHWPKIIGSLIGEEFTNTRKHGPCPKGDGTDRYRFSDKDGNGNYFCSCSDGKRDGFALIQCVKGCDFKAAARHVESVIGKCPIDDKPVMRAETYAERLMKNCTKQSRSKYLESRGLEAAPGLRWHRQVEYRNEEGVVTAAYAGMLAPLVKAGKFVTCQVTYLENGKKADVPVKKKTLPGAAIAGASVALYEPAAEMGIGEGVETCIAAKMLHGVPVWAALSANGLETWEPPSIAKVVMVFGDNDSNFVGHAAAYKLASRLVKMGLKADVAFPPKPDSDWNDFLIESRK